MLTGDASLSHSLAPSPSTSRSPQVPLRVASRLPDHLCPHLVQGAGLSAPRSKITSPFRKAAPCRPRRLPRPHLRHHHSGGGVSTCESGATNLQSAPASMTKAAGQQGRQTPGERRHRPGGWVLPGDRPLFAGATHLALNSCRSVMSTGIFNRPFYSRYCVRRQM